MEGGVYSPAIPQVLSHDCSVQLRGVGTGIPQQMPFFAAETLPGQPRLVPASLAPRAPPGTAVKESISGAERKACVHSASTSFPLLPPLTSSVKYCDLWFTAKETQAERS
ncbi:unnamed protein product [Rangifer tarandus platyrhynchus]|uniref:Uncharacterized protein n=1 Tax=Rangifer tarandus platyrhynchus TaxID=3082113 RepID=A0AC60A932_RANTA